MWNIKNDFFWFFDSLKGGLIQKDYNNIKATLTESIDTTKEINNLLVHAVESTAFYRSADACNLQSFPVVDKTIIRSQLNEFLSNRFSEKDTIAAVTSGSTGTPFKVYHSARKKIRNNADTLYFAGLTGFEPGHALAYLKIWAKEKMSSRFHYWTRNIWPIDVIHLNDSQIESLVSRMERTRGRPLGILGYVSALETVCRYLDRRGLQKVNADVRSIVTMSESLNDYVKEKMTHYFSCEVFSRYSNLENGIIAQQVPGSGGNFLVNSASYEVEILKLNEDVPADPGEMGRIVVTDLYNYALPMIRYDTGDLGKFTKESYSSTLKFFEQIEGRKLDVLYDTSGNLVSSYIMYKNMWKYIEIRQYQLIQRDSKVYVLKVNAESEFNREDQLIDEFTQYLGKDADFTVEYVEEIPLLSSGKRRKLVNEMLSR